MAIIGTIDKHTNPASPHDAYHKRLKAEASHRLASITQEPLAVTRESILVQLVEALEHGSSDQQAEAIMVVSEWLHACHELHEHKA